VQCRQFRGSVTGIVRQLQPPSTEPLNPVEESVRWGSKSTLGSKSFLRKFPEGNRPEVDAGHQTARISGLSSRCWHPIDAIELPPYREDDLEDIPSVGQRKAIGAGTHAAIVKAGQWKAAVQSYLATISFVDAQIGRVLDALEKSPYRDNTIVVLFGDHGWQLGEKHHWGKTTLWEEVARAPLIWIVPGLTKPGSVCARTVDFMSIYPTLTELCGVPTPKHVQGVSLKPLLADPQAPWDRPGVTTSQQGQHSVRTEKWRYIRYQDGTHELYDEIADPFEWTNLAAKKELAGVIQELAVWLPTENKAGLQLSAGGLEEGESPSAKADGAGRRKGRAEKKSR